MDVMNDEGNVLERRFSAVEAAQIVDLQRGLMAAWLYRGHIKVPTRGRGVPRHFDFADLVELAAIVELTRAGMGIKPASDALYSVRVAFREALATNFGDGQSLVIGADRAWVLPSSAVAGFMRASGAKVFTALVIHNVALDVYRALPEATATIPGEATLQAEAIVVRATEQRAHASGRRRANEAAEVATTQYSESR
jgi:MerR HTH family regulatory protein